MHIFLHKCISYGHVTRYACAGSHICLRSRSWNRSRSCLSCLSNTTQTRLCLTVNSFPKSRLFANMNVFKLFDLPKSRLKSLVHPLFCSTNVLPCNGVRRLSWLPLFIVGRPPSKLLIVVRPCRLMPFDLVRQSLRLPWIFDTGVRRPSLPALLHNWIRLDDGQCEALMTVCNIILSPVDPLDFGPHTDYGLDFKVGATYKQSDL